MRENMGLYRGVPKDDNNRHFFADIWKEDCEGSFVYGSLIVSKGKYYICVSAMCKINSCINNGITSMIEVIPETVGQYTGLTDKHGKKIFEGDYVVCRQAIQGNFIDEHIEMGYVEMKHGAFGLHRKQGYYRPFKDWLEDYEYEVIGNIHDNPELLKGGAE